MGLNEFNIKVIKSLRIGIISKEEAKECLKRGLLNCELPLFYYLEEEKSPLGFYIGGLEKMGLIVPLFREIT